MITYDGVKLWWSQDEQQGLNGLIWSFLGNIDNDIFCQLRFHSIKITTFLIAIGERRIEIEEL